MSVDEDLPDVLFRAKLQREHSSSWGFRLQGGLEYDTPLTLLKVFLSLQLGFSLYCYFISLVQQIWQNVRVWKFPATPPDLSLV